MSPFKRRLQSISFLFCIVFGVSYAYASPDPSQQKRVAIIIDDLGVRLKEGQQILALDKRITVSFLPFEYHTQSLLRIAQQQNREVMLHMPMESIVRLRQNKGVIRNNMDEEFLTIKLLEAMQAVPNTVGMNNHRGSLVTQNERLMGWVMKILKPRDMFFIDSKTTAKSVVQKVAKQWRVPSLSRHIFLDHSLEEADINEQFDKVLERVERKGEAIVIGHPQIPTINVLAQRLPELADNNIQIVSVSELIRSHFNDPSGKQTVDKTAIEPTD